MRVEEEPRQRSPVTDFSVDYFTVILSEFDAVEPGFSPVTETLPAVFTSAAGMETERCVPSTQVVVRAELFQNTVAPGRNPLPVTVTITLPLPTAMVLWSVLARDGVVLVDASAGRTKGPRMRKI